MDSFLLSLHGEHGLPCQIVGSHQVHCSGMEGTMTSQNDGQCCAKLPTVTVA